MWIKKMQKIDINLERKTCRHFFVHKQIFLPELLSIFIYNGAIWNFKQFKIIMQGFQAWVIITFFWCISYLILFWYFWWQRLNPLYQKLPENDFCSFEYKATPLEFPILGKNF